MSMSISGAGTNWSQPKVMSGASSWKSPPQKMSDLFQKVDTSNTGTITQAQFAQTFQNVNPPAAFKNMGADTVFHKLSNGNHSVSKQDFVDGMQKLMEQARNQAANNNAPTPAPAGSFASSLASLNALGDLKPSGENIRFSV